MACCVDRVGLQAQATACSPVQCRQGDNMHVGDVPPREACFGLSVRCKP